MDFILSNWEWFLLAFFVAEKIVKQTTTKYDDIILDIVWTGLLRLIGKAPSTGN